MQEVGIETINGVRSIAVEIADDPNERANGLAGRDSLDVGSGMLFVYDKPHRAMFWMLGTTIPLDMIFIEADGTIAVIKPDVQPGSYWPRSGGRNIIAVLEINGGESNTLGIKAGDRVQLPTSACTDSG